MPGQGGRWLDRHGKTPLQDILAGTIRNPAVKIGKHAILAIIAPIKADWWIKFSMAPPVSLPIILILTKLSFNQHQ
jgi:hypothetical protein